MSLNSTWRRSVLALAMVAALTFAVGAVAVEMAAPAAEAQNFGQRVVQGTVVDDGAAPVEGATVFLKNLKTKSIRSFTSPKDGRFRFAGTAMSEDHELWAEKDGRKSAVKTVSTWDARKTYETELKLK